MLVPTGVVYVLEEFVNHMPKSLSKYLSLIRVLYHHIEIKTRKNTLTNTLYHLSMPELEELKRELSELLEVSFI